MGVSLNDGSPKSPIFVGFSILKRSIWGYPHGWKATYISYRFRRSHFSTFAQMPLSGHQFLDLPDIHPTALINQKKGMVYG